MFFHAVARHAVTRFETKGDNPLTENYSVLRPEVLAGANGRPIARPNAPLVDHLLSLDGSLGRYALGGNAGPQYPAARDHGGRCARYDRGSRCASQGRT